MERHVTNNMKKEIYLVISEKLKKLEREDICFYRFDIASMERITDALDRIQKEDAKTHYEEEINK